MDFNIMPSLELYESSLFGVYSLIDTLIFCCNQSMSMAYTKIQVTCVTIHVSCNCLTLDPILYEHMCHLYMHAYKHAYIIHPL